MPDSAARGERVLHGIPASRGVCRGRLFVVRPAEVREPPRYAIQPEDVQSEMDRLEAALVLSRQQLRKLKEQVAQALGQQEALLFEAQLMVLEDPVLLEGVRTLVRDSLVNVDHAFATVAQRFVASFAAMQDDYLKERAADVRDATQRVLHNLLNPDEPQDLSEIREPCILVAHDLTPSQTAVLDRQMILGFATDLGSQTSHTAILARAMHLPAVTGLRDATQRLATGDYALLDGFNGLLIVNPTDQTLYQYGQLARQYQVLEERLREVRELPAVTLDGHRITLSANIENPAEADEVVAQGAEGVGLFRTEFLFMERLELPSEEEQFEVYRGLAEKLHPAPVIIRTLDLGGDKMLNYRDQYPERNPFLGWRAIRICLAEPEMFRAQLRAILRAAVTGNVKMMYPMISGIDEVDQANALLEQCKAELEKEGLPFDRDLEVGVMIEIPSAVLTAEAIARRVRFFSIGTNDLVQYSLAADRLNPRIAHLHQPTHPAVVRLIKQTIDAGHAAGIWVGVCGEMAGDPALAALLIGLGADELSVAPPLVPAVKHLIRSLKLSEARQLADFALKEENTGAILEACQELARRADPKLFVARPPAAPDSSGGKP
ncbi:MAG: phosphoenolpyruvate--protein phosphotransferase [Verrucomicrobia bacterium]|nr:MAG: phosphoenolpyruvate--protein phosphotransferase [Verrucomicrobiota bacterium]